MTRFSLFLALALVAGAASADPVALSQLSIDAPRYDHPVDGAIAYPAAAAGPEEILAENPVFRGVSVQRDAEVAESAHPVVLLSHGMGGEIRSMAWLAAGLAERGAIAVSVTHPNTAWSDFDPTEGIKHWTRGQDLSAAFDTVLDDPRFARSVDAARVMAAGFCYGGWTALSLGGA
jgi:predicted dienelactone hydrolase